jgi:hypothetical protein
LAPLLNLSDATAGRVLSTVEVTLRLGLQEKLNTRERLEIDLKIDELSTSVLNSLTRTQVDLEPTLARSIYLESSKK